MRERERRELKCETCSHVTCTYAKESTRGGTNYSLKKPGLQRLSLTFSLYLVLTFSFLFLSPDLWKEKRWEEVIAGQVLVRTKESSHVKVTVRRRMKKNILMTTKVERENEGERMRREKENFDPLSV